MFEWLNVCLGRKANCWKPALNRGKGEDKLGTRGRGRFVATRRGYSFGRGLIVFDDRPRRCSDGESKRNSKFCHTALSATAPLSPRARSISSRRVLLLPRQNRERSYLTVLRLLTASMENLPFDVRYSSLFNLESKFNSWSENLRSPELGVKGIDGVRMEVRLVGKLTNNKGGMGPEGRSRANTRRRTRQGKTEGVRKGGCSCGGMRAAGSKIVLLTQHRQRT